VIILDKLPLGEVILDKLPLWPPYSNLLIWTYPDVRKLRRGAARPLPLAQCELFDRRPRILCYVVRSVLTTHNCHFQLHTFILSHATTTYPSRRMRVEAELEHCCLPTETKRPCDRVQGAGQSSRAALQERAKRAMRTPGRWEPEKRERAHA